MNTELNRIENRFNMEISEIVLLLIIILVSLYMLIESFSFPEAARRFPLLTSSATLIGSILLLFRSFLPSSAQRFLSDSSQILGSDTEIQQSEDGEDEDEEVDTIKIYKTIVFIIAYGIVSLLISILYATPLFVALHTIWTNQKWYITAFLAGLMFGIGHLFMRFLQVPLDEGLLVGGL